MTPNWFAAVMGTGIVSVMAAALPGDITGAPTVAAVFAVLSSMLLVVLTTALAVTWIRNPESAAADARSPHMFPFYGAVSMAFVTVASAVHHHAPVAITVALWSIGTALGLATYVVMVTRLRTGYPSAPTTVWLMPLVPPMVSATGGAGITEHVPSGAPHVAILLASYGLFVLALAGAIPTMLIVGRHMLRNGLPEVSATPTLWIPLGVVGQSVAAANLLAQDTDSRWLRDFGLVYGCVIGAVGVVALGAVATITVGGFANGLRFNPGWWSFTFPLGACALGANSLGTAAGWNALHTAALVMLCALILIWAAVARGSVRHFLTTTSRWRLSGVS